MTDPVDDRTWAKRYDQAMDTQDVVRTRRIEVVDNDGTVRVVIGALDDELTGLTLHAPDGTEQASLQSFDKGADLCFIGIDDEASLALALGVTEFGPYIKGSPTAANPRGAPSSNPPFDTCTCWVAADHRGEVDDDRWRILHETLLAIDGVEALQAVADLFSGIYASGMAIDLDWDPETFIAQHNWSSPVAAYVMGSYLQVLVDSERRNERRGPTKVGTA